MQVTIELYMRPEMADQQCRQIEKRLHGNSWFAHDVEVKKTFTMRVTSGVSEAEVLAELNKFCMELKESGAVARFAVSVKK